MGSEPLSYQTVNLKWIHLKEKKNWETVADCIEEEISLLILTGFCFVLFCYESNDFAKFHSSGIRTLFCSKK